jgi:hypothetical protein
MDPNEKYQSYEEYIKGPFQNALLEIERLVAAEDPPTEPFKSKYRANEILDNLIQKMQQYLSTSTQNGQSEEIRDQIATLQLRLAINHINTEDNYNGEKFLNLSFEQLKKNEMKNVVYLLEVFNHFGILWVARDDAQTAEKYLCHGRDLYHRYRTQHPLPDRDHQTEEDKKIERLHTYTLFYLAQTYGIQGRTDLSAKYCHLTLKRQYESNEYNSLEFATHCLSISEYYTSVNNYAQARLCLIAAESVINAYASKQTLPSHLRADVAIASARFLLMYLNFQVHLREYEKKQQMGAAYKREYYNSKLNIDDSELTAVRTEEPLIIFHGLVPPPTIKLPELRPLHSLAEAQEYYESALNWFSSALEYYELDGFVTEHVSILQDICSLHQIVAYFESNPRAKIEYHKRRLKLLSPLLKELNPQYFLFTIQQILFTCGEICEQILNIQLTFKNLDTSDSNSSQIKEWAKKCNKTATQSISYFQKFLQTLVSKDPKKSEVIEDHYVESFFHAHLSLARLYQKFVVEDAKSQAANLIKALNEYKLIDEYAKKYKPKTLQVEIELSKQMLKLLPEKIDLLLKSSNNFKS